MTFLKRKSVTGDKQSDHGQQEDDHGGEQSFTFVQGQVILDKSAMAL